MVDDYSQRHKFVVSYTGFREVRNDGMKKHKTKIIVVFVICISLAGAWFLGGAPDISMPGANSGIAEANTSDTSSNTIVEGSLPLIGNEYVGDNASWDTEQYNDPGNDYNPHYNPGDVVNNANEYLNEHAADTPEESVNFDETEGSAPEEYSNAYNEPGEIADISNPENNDSPESDTNPSADYPSIAENYPLADSTPEPTPSPETPAPDGEPFTVTLTVRADMLLYNMHLLDRDKHELVPLDGFIFPQTAVTAYPGESVFNVLQREMRRARIHMASRFTPVFNSAYIEAINNIYEFDAGALSGWVYSVNGYFPGFGSSRYLVGPGYDIVLHFTLDRGRDVGAILPDGGQEDE